MVEFNPNGLVFLHINIVVTHTMVELNPNGLVFLHINIVTHTMIGWALVGWAHTL